MISQNAVWGPSWMMANRARIIESVDDVIAFGRKPTGNRQITVSSGGCVQARCGTIGILTVLLTLDDALLHLLGKAAIFALPQMDLAFHRYIPEFANVPDVMRGNLR